MRIRNGTRMREFNEIIYDNLVTRSLLAKEDFQTWINCSHTVTRRFRVRFRVDFVPFSYLFRFSWIFIPFLCIFVLLSRASFMLISRNSRYLRDFMWLLCYFRVCLLLNLVFLQHMMQRDEQNMSRDGQWPDLCASFTVVNNL